MEPVTVPRLLGEKERILIFHLYEIILIVLGLGLGIIFKMTLLGLFLGFFLFGLSRYLKRKGLINKIPYILYWYLPPWGLSLLQYKLEGTPPSSYRVLTG